MNKNYLTKRSILLVAAIFTTGLQSKAQGKIYESRKEANLAITNSCYTASNGWPFYTDSLVILGKGSLPDKSFAFIKEESSRILDENHYKYFRQPLEYTFSGRKVQISNLIVSGNRTTGFRVFAKIKVGRINRYLMDIEGAIESGELLPTNASK